MKKLIDRNHREDNIDRRGLAWTGTGIAWTTTGGVPTSKLLGADSKASKDDFTIVQISDSHIGFNRPANIDVTGTLKAAIDKINALPAQPEFLIHIHRDSKLLSKEQDSLYSWPRAERRRLRTEGN